MQIVAPAGSYNGLIASVKAGADAVYLGMPLFGARAKAENFDRETLPSAVEYAHLFGVKVFLTLNTLIKDKELDSALETAEFAYSVGVDALIVQDLRIIERIRKRLPDFALHASTQMGIHNAEGARFLQDLGISRGVLARETLPKDIVDIKNTGLEIEYFVQGALCVCFSGNCYFSSLASSYSGNRGKCMQLCRKPYVFNGKRGYFLSAKDLCLYEKLEDLDKLGVDAIKIEGRMRSPEYAFKAVEVYKGEKSFDKPVDTLKSVFNRGNFCTGYIDTNAEHKIIYPNSQGNIGMRIGKITSATGKVIKCSGFVPHAHDGFKIMRNDIEVCGATENNGTVIADGKCRVGDELRRTFDGSVSEELKTTKRTIDISVDLHFEPNNPLQAVVDINGDIFDITGEFTALPAKTGGLTESEVIRTFEKISDYPFRPIIKTSISDNPFVPKSALNEFRRQVYRTVHDRLIDNYKIKRISAPFLGLRYTKFDGHGKILMTDGRKNLRLDNDILSKIDYLAVNPCDYSNFHVPKTDKPVLLNMPITMRDGDRTILEKAVARPDVYGVISNNAFTLKLTDKPILLGTGHNIIGNFEYPHITSFEADTFGNGFIYAFGYAPVMTLCHCPYEKCVNCSGHAELTDERNRKFKLRRIRIGHCYWQLLNCVPNYIGVTNAQDVLYDCTDCNVDDIRKVLDGTYDGKFTRGNLNKGLK